VLGRSSATTLTKRRRAIVVHLVRPLRRGRYTLVAQGRDGESGLTVGATRALRLR
jgi:hypothetical protein